MRYLISETAMSLPWGVDNPYQSEKKENTQLSISLVSNRIARKVRICLHQKAYWTSGRFWQLQTSTKSDWCEATARLEKSIRLDNKSIYQRSSYFPARKWWQQCFFLGTALKSHRWKILEKGRQRRLCFLFFFSNGVRVAG